jgi:calcineurin-like phosphoesterase family protein
MDDVYLIEIRLARTKWRVREKITSVARAFGITPFMERHPHVTLFGPLELLPGTSEQQILDTIGNIASRYGPVPFTLDGFEKREGMHGSVIAFSVHPSDSLRELTAEIALALSPVTKSHNAWDGRPEMKWYHVTVANRLGQGAADRAFSALPDPKSPPLPLIRETGLFAKLRRRIRSFTRPRDPRLLRPILIDETGLRITVMHGDQILAEYDLLEKCWDYRNHRHDSTHWQEALARFRKQAGFELTEPRPAGPGEILLIADLHLGHTNIIRYCSRPFRPSDPGEMDRVLIANWNARALPGTRVYHLGDLCYGPAARPVREYLGRLSGDIVLLAGNHDAPEPGFLPSAEIEYEGMRFYLVHDPADAPAGFDGWIVHGHHHNNELRHFPFIDFEHRRINVSAEVLGYVPVSLSDICRLIRYRTETGNTRPVLLNYPYVE